MMTVLALKDGFSFKGIRAEIVAGLQILTPIASNLGIKTLVLTAGTNGKHGDGSLHYSGLALDIRSRNLTREQKMGLLQGFNTSAGKNFDFILEDQGLDNEHFHLEYDEHP
jgi:hypothetical protein